ncbi:MAG: hypothetical protein IKW59_06905 [Clostridia bacterium]|nr:hypothetical protein [Clostridia bacterium]
MSFIDSYKHLEKLCGEILNDDRRLSAYIDEMINTPNGNYYVNNWDDDLKTLKHYRWVRNQISHEPGCNESNMCDPKDELWLNHFYSRIMKQTDPLSMYRKARSSTNNSRSRAQASYEYRPQTDISNYQSKQKRHYLRIILWVIIVLILFLWFSNK